MSDHRGVGCVGWVAVVGGCARLYQAGLFSTLVFTGGPNPTKPGRFPRGEAVHFSEHAQALGVPAEAIVVEPRARNTGENIRFSREALTQVGAEVKSVLLVSMPYMERRAYATARKEWPEVDITCTSAPLDFDDYLKTMDNEQFVVDMLIGDLNRIIEYPERGFAIQQDIPQPVLHAYQSLINAGYTSRLLKPT
ncbi:YdcF family protein [Spiractinospora alimapuensis]|uniref:YdcF family protein n=1 Tax=Spiractinospora alimapuensis TaxID=2820884 RepID=UPI001F336717|nr:YdcF family protein [Spiractinospora alimapuensis]QVQ50860.1 YdcF family protein [Spiractinospora alimapuensis]